VHEVQAGAGAAAFVVDMITVAARGVGVGAATVLSWKVFE
jgi:hypothetical protein